MKKTVNALATETKPRPEFGKGARARLRARGTLGPGAGSRDGRIESSNPLRDLNVFVEPHERLRMVFARLWDEAHAFVRGHGYRWAISRISATNITSLGAPSRLGAEVLGRMSFLFLGRWQVV